MISWLKGRINSINQTSVILEINNVGYLIFCSLKTLEAVLDMGDGELVEFYIHTYFKQDRLELYGFLSKQDLDLFELLLGVSGVGPRTALGIFNQALGEQIKQAISSSDMDFFSTVKGLGKKTAQKIILDLREKVSAVGASLSDVLSQNNNDEVVGALKDLGYKKEEASLAVKDIPHDLPVDQRVRMALKMLAKK